MTESEQISPLLLLISGAPGSGKTTLASELSARMGLYHVERDKLKHGIEFILDTPPEDRIRTVVPVYFRAITSLLELNISCIADGAHFRGRSEDDLKELGSGAVTLNIHCRSQNARQRAESRDIARGGLDEAYRPDYDRIFDESLELVEHGFPTLEVDSNDGYDPSLDVIVGWVRERFDNASHAERSS